VLRWAEAGFAGGREERMEEVGAMKEVIYQHIKTYEVGLFCFVNPSRYEVGTSRSPGIQPRGVEVEA
jgi:hypothetical protein